WYEINRRGRIAQLLHEPHHALLGTNGQADVNVAHAVQAYVVGDIVHRSEKLLLGQISQPIADTIVEEPLERTEMRVCLQTLRQPPPALVRADDDMALHDGAAQGGERCESTQRDLRCDHGERRGRKPCKDYFARKRVRYFECECQ